MEKVDEENQNNLENNGHVISVTVDISPESMSLEMAGADGVEEMNNDAILDRNEDFDKYQSRTLRLKDLENNYEEDEKEQGNQINKENSQENCKNRGVKINGTDVFMIENQMELQDEESKTNSLDSEYFRSILSDIVSKSRNKLQHLYHKKRKIEDKGIEAYRVVLGDLTSCMYGLLIIVFGLVLPVSHSLSDGEGYGEYYVKVFQIYIYTVSIACLGYLRYFIVRDKRHGTFGKEGSVNNVLPKFNSADAIEMVPDEEMQEKPPIYYDNQCFNFYLRLGALGFGTGSMLHDGFKLAQIFEGDNHFLCNSPLYIVLSLAHLCFTFCQTFFLFKSHGVIFNAKKSLVRWCLLHTAATNICVWVHTVILETSETFAAHERSLAAQGLLQLTTPEGILKEGLPSERGNLSFSSVDEYYDYGFESISCLGEHTIARRASPYLFPCSIEYSLVAAAMVYHIYKDVGKPKPQEVTTVVQPSVDSNNLECHKANTGLFLGILVAVITLIGVSCFFVFHEQSPNTGSLIFNVTELVLLTLSLFAVLVGFHAIRNLEFRSDKEVPFEMILLVTGLLGLCIFHIFLILSSLAQLSFEFTPTAIMTLVMAVLATVQASVQTVLILEGVRRNAATMDHINNKPGRATVTFLLLCNLSLWVIDTFEVEEADSIPMHVKFYGFLAWSIISHFCIPLIIFFRFHSTVFLSDIWVKSYLLVKPAIEN